VAGDDRGHQRPLDLRGDGDAFEVRLDLEAREGDELRWTRELAAPHPQPPGLTRRR
jgi:hypothetical protein